MKILHLTRTQLAGAPLKLSQIINKYTPEHSSHVFLQQMFTGETLRHLDWAYPAIGRPQSEINAAVEEADIVVHHQYPWHIRQPKHQAILYHAQPRGYVPEVSDAPLNGQKMVVAQYQTRFYTDARPMPNMIDIWQPDLLPGPKEGPITLFMGVASETPSGWGNKNSTGVREVFHALKDCHGDAIEVLFIKGRPYQEVLPLKRRADIVIDECTTGSYHLSSLEGLSLGAVVVNNIDEHCQQSLLEVSGAKAHPFVRSNMVDLYQILDELIRDVTRLRQLQHQARTWAEAHWCPKTLVNHYLQFFQQSISNSAP